MMKVSCFLKKLNFLNKPGFKESFKSKKFRYGGYATLLSAVVIGVLILINLVVGEIPLKLDLTENKLFSFSEQTLEILKTLQEDVTIYSLNEPGKEDAVIYEILKKYRDSSARISLKQIDPYKNPGFVKQYEKGGENLSVGSVIVAGSSRYKVIPSYDLVNFDFNSGQAQSLAVEQRITSAVQYVVTGESPVVYLLQGHGEKELFYEIKNQLEKENYQIKELTLLPKEEVPEDAALLLINSPKRDLSGEEEEKIRKFLSGKGKALFLMDLSTEEMPNFKALFKSFGIALRPVLVVEGDSSMHAGNPVWLLPKLEEHEITAPLKKEELPVLIPGAQSIEELEVKKRSLEIKPLLVTSGEAWGKVNLNSEKIEKEEGDLRGPFHLAVTVSEKDPADYGKTTRKMVVVANSYFVTSQFVTQIPGNMDLLLNSMRWLREKDDNLTIRPKSLMTFRLRINGFQALLFSGIVVVVIPLSILGAGLLVWLRRRHL